MNQNQRGRGNNREDGNGSSPWYWGGMVAGAAALVGGIYYLSKTGTDSQQPQTNPYTNRRQRSSSSNMSGNGGGISSYLSGLLGNLGLERSNSNPPPSNPVINNLNSLLEDIYVRFISIKDDDFELYYGVFMDVLRTLHQRMKEVDPYFERYSSAVKFAGSHYDRLRIDMPDEFDMDIVLRLPLNMSASMLSPADSDIIIEPKSPGFVQLKMGVQYQRLPFRDGSDWNVNKAAYEWKDDSNFLLRSKFIYWFKSVVNKALNKFESQGTQRIHKVNSVPFSIRISESGPAITLIIENTSRNFRCDVDLVPALQFPESRWPISNSYRRIPLRCSKDGWMVVPKPNKAGLNQYDVDRSWRLAMHEQERELMHDTNNLRHAIRLMKKLRDSQGMTAIASYYIKSLFYLEVIEKNDSTFWRINNPATLFKIMLEKFYRVLIAGNLPYFWNSGNNLLGGIPRQTLDLYATKVAKVIEVLNQPENYKMVAKYLLSASEFATYNEQFLHI